MPKTIVVLPAYNAAKTLRQTIADLPTEYIDEIILVDDFSNDETLQVAQELNLTTIRHYDNRGYGANQKTCYQLALEHGADIIVMLHPDYQYDPKLIKYFVEFIRDDYFDVMLGSRIRSRRETQAGGMPGYKYFANRLLTFLENIVTGQNLSEWHTGMRAYKKEVIRSIDFHRLSDDFVFDTQILLAITKKHWRIGDIPVPVRYQPNSSSINLRRSIRYGLGTLWELVKYPWKK
ncbi:MAG: glycosyltransferase family 2 protein [Candidatus Komeilibacteria bacterium]